MPATARVTPADMQRKLTPADRAPSHGSFSHDNSKTWKVMHSLDMRKSKAQKEYETRIMGDAKPGYIDVDVGYSQERASIFSFFHMFPQIICRYHGSVIPTIVIEIVSCTTLGAVASVYWKDSDDLSPIGHQLVGVLLSFLVVFRSQIAWNMYLSGYQTLTTLRTHIISIANVTMAPMLARCRGNPAKGVQPTPLPEEAHELVRMLKLFYFLCCEHLRSTEGSGPWQWSQTIAYSYALPREIKEFDAEYGTFQDHEQRTDVQWVHGRYQARVMEFASRPAHSNGWLDQRKKIGEANMQDALAWELGGAEPPKPRVPLSAWRDDKEIESRGLGAQYVDKGNSYDPTRGKVLKVLLWLQVLLGRIEGKCAKGTEEGGYMKMAGINQINALGTQFYKLYQIDTLVLPLPYNQLLKIFLLVWTFTLPFAIAAEVGWYNPPIMMLVSAAFFGLDQVGGMLEQPFGVEAADISLLHLGAEVADDLDSILRSAEKVADAFAEAAELAQQETEAMAKEETETMEFTIGGGKTRPSMKNLVDNDDGDDDAGDDAGDDGGNDDGGDDGGGGGDDGGGGGE